LQRYLVTKLYKWKKLTSVSLHNATMSFYILRYGQWFTTDWVQI